MRRAQPELTPEKRYHLMQDFLKRQAQRVRDANAS